MNWMGAPDWLGLLLFLAAVCVVASVVYMVPLVASWLLGRWRRHRKPMPPMPPLPLRCPGHERPHVPLTTHERLTFWVLSELYPQLEARDPQEKP